MNKHAAADAIRQAIRPFRILNEYADELEKLGSLEQAAEEAKRNADIARAELEKVKGQVAKAKESLDDFHKKVEEGAKMNGALAQETIARANADAAEIVEQAKSSAATIVSDAITQASKEIAAASQRVADAAGQLQSIHEQTTVAMNERDQAKAEFERINTQLEVSKAKLSAFLA
jgi:dsDNA-specific endonuclease/ATPase MutS2